MTTRTLGVALAVALWLPPMAAAQPPGADANAKFDQLIKERWDAALKEAAAGKTLSTLSADDKKATYAAAFKAMFAKGELKDQSVLDLFDDNYLDALTSEESTMKRAEDVDARASNPAMAGFVERSGATKLIALGSDLSNLVGADKSAVTINLNALALVGLKNDTVYSAPRQYQRYDALRRVSGSVTFGAKIPEKEITGFSGIPGADTLFDAWSWDVKVRVFGDRDSRAGKWKKLNIKHGGSSVQAAALIATLVPPTDAPMVATIADSVVVEARDAVVATIKRSLQASVKVAGTHLSKEEGQDKFSATFILDAPLGPADLTMNVQYAKVDDVRFGVDQLFQIKTFTASASVTAEFAKGFLEEDRSINWVLSGNANVFQDKNALPIPAKNTFRLTSSVELPLGKAAKIPLSVVYSNDPNALKDQNHVWSGQVGLSYDFTALKSLFQK